MPIMESHARRESIGSAIAVLRDGRRVQGELVAVRDGVIEFEGQRGLFGRERQRFDREDVLRIELDGVGGATGNRYDSDRNSGRDDRNSTRDGYGATDTRPSGMRERHKLFDLRVAVLGALSDADLG